MSQTDTVAVGLDEGQVVLAFQKEVKWLKLDPMTALMVGEEIAKKSYELTYGAPPAQGQSALKIEIVAKLNKRIELVMSNLQQRKKSPSYIAQELVNIVLSEVK